MSLNTLEFTSDTGVRAVLVALCADPAIKKKALGLIAKLEPHAANLAANYATRNGAPLKRKATGQAICIQCDNVFDEGENRVKKCCYHSGAYQPTVLVCAGAYFGEQGKWNPMMSTGTIMRMRRSRSKNMPNIIPRDLFGRAATKRRTRRGVDLVGTCRIRGGASARG